MVANSLTETGSGGRRKLELDGAELRFPAIQFNSSGGGVVIVRDTLHFIPLSNNT